MASRQAGEYQVDTVRSRVSCDNPDQHLDLSSFILLLCENVKMEGTFARGVMMI